MNNSSVNCEGFRERRIGKVHYVVRERVLFISTQFSNLYTSLVRTGDAMERQCVCVRAARVQLLPGEDSVVQREDGKVVSPGGVPNGYIALG